MKRLFARLGAAAVAVLMVVGVGTGPAYAAAAFYYAGGFQDPPSAATDLTANVSVYAPPVDTTKDAHSLAELAVGTYTAGVQKGVVEVGWSVDPSRFPGADAQKPHLFTTIWINGVFQGYAATGFVECNGANCGQATDVFDLNDVLTSGTTMRLGMQYNSTGSTGWWVIAYLSTGTFEYLGYWPTSVFSTAGITFTTATRIWAFGEVATNSSGILGCTDMADGVLATSTAGGVIGSVSASPNASTAIDIDAHPQLTNSSYYNLVPLGTLTNTRTFRYGGPGPC